MISIEEQFGINRPQKEKKFYLILLAVLLLLLLIALFFQTVEVVSPNLSEKVNAIATSFTLPQHKEKPKPKVEKKPKVQKKKAPKKKPTPKPKEVLDLTKNPRLNAKEEVVTEKPKEKVRAVYGVKKVYSKGLGTGGKMSDAVVGKQGNTTNKSVDTLTATRSDLLGEIAPATTITKAPRFKRRVTPKITKEIRKSGVNGVIKVKVLIDIDGKVKEALAQNDLGFGTKEAAIEACLKMTFSPAYRKKEKVAVWIIIPVRFEKLN